MVGRISGSLDDGRVTFAQRESAGEAPRRPRCDELMQRKVQVVAEHDSVLTAADKMRLANIGFLPVCDSAQKVIGAITDRDIAIRVVAENLAPSDCLVKDVMSRNVVTCQTGDDVDVAERFMAQYQKSRIVVTDEGGHLRGIISLSDIALHDTGLSLADVVRAIASREAQTKE